MANVSLNLNNVQTGVGAGANSGFNTFLNPLKASTKAVKPPKNVALPTKTGNAAGMFSGGFGGVGTGGMSNVTGKSLATLGRLNPISEEDDLIKQALNNLEEGHPPADVYKAYPEIAKKLSIVADFNKDAEARNETGDLFAAYPELSDSLKAEVFNHIKEYQKNQAAQQGPEIGSMVTEPVAPKKTFGQNLKDVGEGIVSYAGGIPKAIAETGLLDKEAQRLADKVKAGGGGFVGKWIRDIAASDAGKAYAESQKNPDGTVKKFSEAAAGSQVGGDPNSKVAKGVSNTMTALEMISGAGAIKGALKSKALTKAILPEMTKAVTEARDLAKLTRITKVLGKKVAVLSPYEVEMKKVAGKVIKSGGTATKNVSRAIAAGEKETDNLIKIVTKANKVIDRNAVKNAIEKVPMTISVKNDKLLAKNYKDFVAGAKKVIDAMPDDKAETLLRARKDIDKLVRSEFPGIFEDAANKPLTDMIKKARQVINTSIDDAVGDKIVKDSLHKQSLLYDLAENIATKSKSEAMGSTRLSRYIKRHPIIRKTGSNIVQGAVAGGVLAGANKLMGGGSNKAANAPE